MILFVTSWFLMKSILTIHEYRLGVLQYPSSVHSLACPPILFGCSCFCTVYIQARLIYYFCLNYRGSKIICQSLFSFSSFVYSLWCVTHATRFVLTQNKLWNVGIEQGNIISFVHTSGLWLSSAGWTLRISGYMEVQLQQARHRP